MAAQHSTNTNFTSRYKFNGKELDQEIEVGDSRIPLKNNKKGNEQTGWYYYGARYYDPSISTWLSVDPLVEKYQSFSPYNYTLNNPINLIDPDGRQVDDNITVNSKGIVTNVIKNDKPNRFFDEDGNELRHNNPKGVDKIYMESQWKVGDRVFYTVTNE